MTFSNHTDGLVANSSERSDLTRSCTTCVYDSRIPYITFDESGRCNYCKLHEQLDGEYPTGEEGARILERMASRIREAGRGRRYDVVVGVSGGTDSSYLLVLAKELGLRPLAVHFDNTWNSTTAVENIRAVIEALNVDLYTHVVDNEEFCDLFRSFLLASVPDIDTPSDIGLATTHYLAAAQHGVKYIFEGHSFRTEGISPHGWFYMDAKYIADVHRRFGSVSAPTFPNLWMGRWLWWTAVKGIKKLRPLYYVDYDKERTKSLLSTQYGWQWYGGHHMENRTSYFTNNYYLPKKFGIDLRYCELSALVRSGQMSREAALATLSTEKHYDKGLIQEVQTRLRMTEEEFDAVMRAPGKTYRDYKTYKSLFERLRPLFYLMSKLDMVPKSFYLKYTKRY